MSGDPADLSNLHDIVLPPAVPFWPLAPGMWILLAGLLCALVIVGARLVCRYRRDAWRRAALRELAALQRRPGETDAQAVSALLKRAAMVADPRTEVASLTGADWLAFLRRTRGAFDGFAGEVLLGAPHPAPVSSGERESLFGNARLWLRRHRATREEGSC